MWGWKILYVKLPKLILRGKLYGRTILFSKIIQSARSGTKGLIFLLFRCSGDVSVGNII